MTLEKRIRVISDKYNLEINEVEQMYSTGVLSFHDMDILLSLGFDVEVILAHAELWGSEHSKPNEQED